MMERMVSQDQAIGQMLDSGLVTPGTVYGERFVPRGFRAGFRVLP